MTKIITFAGMKGGIGKTTLAYNYGEWLAKDDNKILFIDLDEQCNLTHTYNIYSNKHSAMNIFDKQNQNDVEIINIKKNIDIIIGNHHIDRLEDELVTISNKEMILFMWFADNNETYQLESYDYIIFDTHPNFKLITQNAIAVSTHVFSPVVPNKFSYDAIFDIEQRINDLKNSVIDYRTRESFITANVYFIGNMIKHNTNSSRAFLENSLTLNNMITTIPYKELFNTSVLTNTSLSDMEKDGKLLSKHRDFFKHINKSFEIMTNTINEEY